MVIEAPNDQVGQQAGTGHASLNRQFDGRCPCDPRFGGLFGQRSARGALGLHRVFGLLGFGAVLQIHRRHFDQSRLAPLDGRRAFFANAFKGIGPKTLDLFGHDPDDNLLQLRARSRAPGWLARWTVRLFVVRAGVILGFPFLLLGRLGVRLDLISHLLRHLLGICTVGMLRAQQLSKNLE